MSDGVFGEPGTYGERDNRSLFKKGIRTLEAATKAFEMLALQMHIADLQIQFDRGHCTFNELDNARGLAKKLIEETFQEKEERFS
jgi:cell fate regulator YaaT (PSP1 superfamily)